MKKCKFLNILAIVLFVLQLIAEVGLLIAILRLDMLPGKLLIPVILLFAVGLLLTAVLVFWPVQRGKTGTGRRVIACLLAVLVIGMCVFAFTVVEQVRQTMQTITDTPQTEGPTRQVFVLTEDPAQTLQDAAGYTFGIVENYDVEYTAGAIAYLEQQLGGSIQTKTYPSVFEMVDGLYAGDCGAIILNAGYTSILEDQSGYEGFSDKTRILLDALVLQTEPPEEPTQEVTEPVEQDTQEATVPVETPSVTNTPFIMYVSGSDTRSSKLNIGNSDVNILVIVNPKTKQVLLLNTPRDYYIPNPAGGGALDKLTHCGVYGVDCSIEALSDLYDIEVDYYSQINFTGFETLVDAVGGVTVNSPVGFTSGGVTIYKGENHLNGAQALVFARERYQMPGGDNGRGQNQMKVIKAIITKATTGTTIITNYSQILKSLEGMFVTSMEMSEISQLVKMQLSDMATWNIQTYAVTGRNGSEKTYSIPGLYASVMYQDQGRIDYGKQLIQRVVNGEILTEQDVKYPE